MAEYALIETGTLTVRKFRDWGAETPPDATHKGLKWVPVTRTPRPTDIRNLYAPGWEVTLDGITRTWTATLKTGQDLLDALEAEYNRRIDAVASPADRDYYAFKAISLVAQSQAIPLALRNGVAWLAAMREARNTLRTAILGGGTPDITDNAAWPPAP